MRMMTARELTDGIRRANAQCEAEISAARDVYNGERRKIAAVRKAAADKARQARDAQVAVLHEQLTRERRAAPVRTRNRQEGLSPILGVADEIDAFTAPRA
jgi:hypothetical protein